jgi:hypothetical protein
MKKSAHGGARAGAGRKKRAGWKQTSVSIPESAWKDVKRLAARRKKSGEKNASAAAIAGELVESALVYFGLEEEKRVELEQIAKERGVSFDAIVSQAVGKFLEQKKTTPKPLIVKKFQFAFSALRALPAERRSAIMLFGVLVTQTNWLHKLLIKTTESLPKRPTDTTNDPESQANFALTILLLTTLVGKIHEGWKAMGKGKLRLTLAGLSLPAEIKALQEQLRTRLSRYGLINQIRNRVGFHFDEEFINFSELEKHLDDKSTAHYVTEAGYQGDMISHLSTLAILDPLLGFANLVLRSSGAPIDVKNPPLAAYRRVLDEVVEIGGLFGAFISSVLTVLIIREFQGRLSIETIPIHDAPESGEERVRFFLHPPRNLKEIKAGKVEP